MACHKKEGEEMKEVPCDACDSQDYSPGVLANTGTSWVQVVREILMVPPLKCCDCIPPAQPCPPPEDENTSMLNACMKRLRDRQQK